MSITLINYAASSFLYEIASKNILTESFAIFLSDGIFLLAICAYVLVVYPLRKKGKYLRTIFQDISPAIFAGIAVSVVKYFSHIERPFVTFGFTPFVPQPDPYGSFPSFHVAVFAAFATTLVFHHRKFGVFLLSLLPLVIIGRIAIGVHWLTDVVAGAILGSAISIRLYKINYKSIFAERFINKYFVNKKRIKKNS